MVRKLWICACYLCMLWLAVVAAVLAALLYLPQHMLIWVDDKMDELDNYIIDLEDPEEQYHDKY